MTNPAVSPIGTHSLALIFGGVGCASKLRASGTTPTTTAPIRSRQKILFMRFSQCQHLNRNTVSSPIKYSSWSPLYIAGFVYVRGMDAARQQERRTEGAES